MFLEQKNEKQNSKTKVKKKHKKKRNKSQHLTLEDKDSTAGLETNFIFTGKTNQWSVHWTCKIRPSRSHSWTGSSSSFPPFFFASTSS